MSGPPGEGGERRDATLEAALLALGEGRPEEALTLLGSMDSDRGERYAHACSAWLALGSLEQASEALDAARERLAPDDPLLAWAEGSLDLFTWRIPEARAAFERLRSGGQPESALESLSLLADLEGDPARADRLLRELRRIDPRAAPLPARLDPDGFRNAVRAAAERLPAEFRRVLDDVCVVIDPMPTRELLGAPCSGLPPDILGLFLGRTAVESSLEVSAEHPPTIHLFQRNLERISPDIETLREEIRVTLYHELAHALGFGEEGVVSLGLD